MTGKQKLIEELKKEVADAVLIELDKFGKRRVQPSASVEISKEVFKGVRNPQPAEDNSLGALPAVVIPPVFPRLLVSAAGKKLEYVVAQNYADWAPVHHFYVVFPPQQAASKPITTTLEAEIEKLTAQGYVERPKTEHERRRQTQGYTI